ncbi:hypothetical protein IL306_000779, partial [Fusarium sp. DS 682]
MPSLSEPTHMRTPEASYRGWGSSSGSQRGSPHTQSPFGSSQATNSDYGSSQNTPHPVGVSPVSQGAHTEHGLRQSSIHEHFWAWDERPRPAPRQQLLKGPEHELLQFYELIAGKSGYSLQQLAMASTLRKKNKAWKETRNVVLKVKIDPDASKILSPEAILTKCAHHGFPFNSIKAVQFPPLETDRILLIIGSDLEAREIRKHETQLRGIINNPNCRLYPEEFYSSPANITGTEVKNWQRHENKALEYKGVAAMFKKPKERLGFWKRETGLNIDRGYWKYGRLWFVLRDRAEAQKAASGRIYSLEGMQTSFECKLWRGRAHWDTKGLGPRSSEPSSSNSGPDGHDDTRTSRGIHEILRDILSDQGAASPDDSLLSFATGSGGEILVRLIKALVQVLAPQLGGIPSTNTFENNFADTAETRKLSPSPWVLSGRSRLSRVTGDLSLASSPRQSARVLYDYANGSHSRETPSPERSISGVSWHSDVAYPERLASFEPPSSYPAELGHGEFAMDTSEELFQREAFELSADHPVELIEKQVFELAADRRVGPGHDSASATQHEDASSMVLSDFAPDISLDSLPELSQDII